MASISCEKKTGRRTIQFVGPGGRRHSVRFGKISKRQAEAAKLFIEDLLTAQRPGSSPKAATAEWVADLPDGMRRRLERAGLIAPQERRQCPTLAEWLQRYIGGRKDVKPRTLLNYRQAEAKLLEFFGGDKRLDDISRGDAEDFRVFLKAKKKRWTLKRK